jgi:hypothetical protein
MGGTRVPVMVSSWATSFPKLQVSFFSSISFL